MNITQKIKVPRAEKSILALIDMHERTLEQEFLKPEEVKYHRDAVLKLTDILGDLCKLYYPEDMDGSDWADKARERGLQY